MVLTKTGNYQILLRHDQRHASFALTDRSEGPVQLRIWSMSHSFVYPHILAPPLYAALGLQDDPIQVSAPSELQSSTRLKTVIATADI